VDLQELAVEPIIVPHADDDGTFWIEDGSDLQLYTGFADFAADLEARIDAGGWVKIVLAKGEYVDESGVLTSRMVIVKLLKFIFVNQLVYFKPRCACLLRGIKSSCSASTASFDNEGLQTGSAA
jgi:hypothetical protein